MKLKNIFFMMIAIGLCSQLKGQTVEIDNATINLTVPSVSDPSKIEFNNGPIAGYHSFFKIENSNDVLKFEVDTDLTFATGYDPIMFLRNSGLSLQNGTIVNEFSTDGTLSGDSNNALPTEKAVKTYVDNATEKVIFKVRGNGFAVKDIDGGTEVETDIWEIEIFDTANAFNTTTGRFIAPSSGYYFFHACVDQSNFTTPAYFRLRFNRDTNAIYSTIVDGDDVKTEVSGIYYLNTGDEVYVLLRNFTTGEDERMDGTGSWFEGYKL